jgi:hypothetical protein
MLLPHASSLLLVYDICLSDFNAEQSEAIERFEQSFGYLPSHADDDWIALDN